MALEEDFDEKIRNLLKMFSGQAYSTKSSPEDKTKEEINNTCITLWRKDYVCEIVDNSNGVICDSYPRSMVLPLCEGGSSYTGVLPNSSPLKFTSHYLSTEDPSVTEISNSTLSTSEPSTPTFASVVAGSAADSPISNVKDTDIQSNANLVRGLRSHLKAARHARCRYRVPFPVILCKGKYITRSATLSVFLDVFRKNIVLYATDPKESGDDSKVSGTEELQEAVNDMPEENSFHDVETARNADINLLKFLNVSQIIDLMVENKKQKFYVHVSSSEKADSNKRYSDFRIASMPYPGCEFFENFTKNNLSSDYLEIDWNSSINDAVLSLPDSFDGRIPSSITEEWDTYKTWDLRKITKNYLRYISDYVTDDKSQEKGLLVHCISGWDRTPLFISLLRLSLWADGHIHTTLDASQILYFTLAYDWYLFGHQLHTRLVRKENIMYFCFEFLEKINEDSFLDPKNSHLSTDSENGAMADYEIPVSFGSTASLEATVNNIPSNLSQQPNIKISNSITDIEGSQCGWPYNKENGFTFDGMQENGEIESRMSGLTVSVLHNSVNICDNTKKVSPSRSPLIENNSDRLSIRSRRISGEELCTSNSSSASSLASPQASSSSSSENKGSFRSTASYKKNLIGLLKDSAVKSPKKDSTIDPPERYHADSDQVVIDSPEFSGNAHSSNSDNEVGDCSDNFVVSNPVAVPGARSRHESVSSISSSWLILSPSEAMENHRSSMNSLAANNEDLANTIQEEAIQSSSTESSQSYITFNRKRRLAKVKELFYKLYGESSALPQEQTGIWCKW